MKRITSRAGHYILFFILYAVLIPFPSPGHAETRYVTDELSITMRRGMGNDYKIIRNLDVGTPLEILEEQGKYLKVRAQDGTEGWVRTQYITSEVPSVIVVTRLEKEIKRLKTKVEKAEGERDSLRDELKSTRSSYENKVHGLKQDLSTTQEGETQASLQLNDLTERYNTLLDNSQNVVAVVDERDRLKNANDRLSKEVDLLQEENRGLKRMDKMWWFLAGGGVLFVGWLAGKVSRKKRHY